MRNLSSLLVLAGSFCIVTLTAHGSDLTPVSSTPTTTATAAPKPHHDEKREAEIRKLETEKREIAEEIRRLEVAEHHRHHHHHHPLVAKTTKAPVTTTAGSSNATSTPAASSGA